ncbi:hypothetical protein GCM10027399_15620 [Curvibacter fontanus]
MHSAPAVSYPVGRSSMRTACLLSPWLLAGLVCAAWALQSDLFSTAHGLALLLWLSGARLVHAALSRPAEGLLAWDGQNWNWESPGMQSAGQVHRRLDWQRGLLLEFLPLAGRSFWLWVERGTAPQQWEGLRRAVYAPVASAPSVVPVQQETGS